jgi:hypothetical protein
VSHLSAAWSYQRWPQWPCSPCRVPRAGKTVLSVHPPRSAAYACKMEPHPEERADFSAFSKMRRIPLDPESVIGRELLDGFAEFDESFTGHSRIWAVVVKLVGLTAMCSKAVIDLEKQVIELRRELRSRDTA